MNSIVDFITSNQVTVMAAAFVALLICYFLFKQLIKLALLMVLIAMAVGGYYYFKDPKKAPGDIRQTIQETREKSSQLLEKGQQAYKKGKDLIDKSKDLTDKAADFIKKTEEKPEPGK